MQDDRYEIIVPAVGEVIRLIEAKDYLKIDDDITKDDILIDQLIISVTDLIEKYTNRILLPTTITGHFANLVRTEFEAHPFLQIRRAPLTSVVSVKGMVDSVLTDIPTTDYFLKETATYSRILFSTAPSVDTDLAYPLQVSFVAGYSPVPDALKVGLKEWISFLYFNRGDVIPEGKELMPSVVEAILTKYRILNTF